jgi:MFS transporter, ACS family, hexuronate transporter
MSPEAISRPPVAVPRRSWVLLGFVAIAAVLFIVDRQVMSLLKTTLRDEIGLTDVQYGWLITAFMVPYTVMYMFTGAWIDRWGTRIMSLVFIGVMSLATVLMGLADTFAELFVARMILGVAEAGIIPCSILFVVTWFPRHLRATAISIKSPLGALGQVATPPLVAWVTLSFGWHMAFIIPGVIGLVVAVVWYALDHGAPDYGEVGAEKDKVKPSAWRLLADRTLWPLLAVRVMSDPFWFFLLYWHAGFLQEHLGLTLAQVGQWAWIPPLFNTLGNVTSGVVSDRLIARGWPVRRARTAPLIAVTVLAPLAWLLPFTPSIALAIALLTGLYIMCGTWLTITNIFVADLVPRSSVATAVGVLSAVGGLTSVLFNLVAGWLVGSFGYTPLLLIGALLHPIAAVVIWRTYTRRGAAAAS